MGASSLDVVEFRKGEWNMLWRHGILEGGFAHDAAKNFGANGVPTLILHDPDGKIVATGNALRGEELMETLAGHFHKSKIGS